MNTKDLFKDAPIFLTKRYTSINKHIWENLFPEELRNERFKRKSKLERKAEFARMKKIADEATVVAFIFLIRLFFLEGSKAARQAVDTFKELNVDSFYIGSTLFQGRNENVQRGNHLAALLMNSIKDERLKEMIFNSHTLSDIINQYKEILKRQN